MPQVGPMEILVVAVVALIVFGPQRLPEITRTLGRTLNEFRRQAQQIRTEFESGIHEMDPSKALAQDDDEDPGLPITTRLDEGHAPVEDEPEGPPELADDQPDPSSSKPEDR